MLEKQYSMILVFACFFAHIESIKMFDGRRFDAFSKFYYVVK